MNGAPRPWFQRGSVYYLRSGVSTGATPDELRPRRWWSAPANKIGLLLAGGGNLMSIATGMVDWVPHVADMPARILDYSVNEHRLRLPPEDGPQPAKPANLPRDEAEANRNGKFVAGIGMHDAVPRPWKPEEIGLIQEVASRILASVERARA